MKYLVTISFILFALLLGCNPAKRAAKQQQQFQNMLDEYNKNHPPRIDTVTKYLKGTDSSKYFKRLADSIAVAMDQQKTDVKVKYRDTCTTAVDTYNDGFETGYQAGLYEGKLTAPVRIDTVFRTVTPTDQIELLKRKLHEWEVKYYQQQTETQKSKKQSNTWMWFFIAASVVVILLTILTLKKLFRP